MSFPSIRPEFLAPRGRERYKSHLSMTLSDLRAAAGLTQAKLAHRVGVERRTIIRWEAGVAVPRATDMRPLAYALGVTVEDVIDAISSRQSA